LESIPGLLKRLQIRALFIIATHSLIISPYCTYCTMCTYSSEYLSWYYYNRYLRQNESCYLRYTIKDNPVLPRRAYRVTNFFPYTALQGVTKRCRLSWLTNSSLVYEHKCGGFGVSANEHTVQLYTGAQINFGDLTPYFTYAALH
jgi:hypothetical protein